MAGPQQVGEIGVSSFGELAPFMFRFISYPDSGDVQVLNFFQSLPLIAVRDLGLSAFNPKEVSITVGDLLNPFESSGNIVVAESAYQIGNSFGFDYESLMQH